MKIKLLTTDYLPNIGGVAQHIYELARALAAAGDEIEVIAPAYSTDPRDLGKPPFAEGAPGFGVWRIPWCVNRSVRFFSGQITGRLSKRRFSKLAVRRLLDSPPDLLHWHALDTRGYPAENFSGPRVWTNHTSNFINGIKTAGGLGHYRREAAAAQQIICPSQELADLTVQIGVPRERVHFITNGVDTARFNPQVDPAPWRARLRVGGACRLVLCPRRLEKKNGVKYFIEGALALLRGGLKDCVFAVAGNFTGPKSESDEDVVRQLLEASGFADSFRLLGRVENREIPGLYAAATLVVMPSLIEATSLSAMEAMATGKAIVSTDVGGLPFLVRDGENGVLVPPMNAAALADGVRRLLADSTLRERFGAAGRKRAENELDWKVVATATHAIYELALQRR